MSNQRSRANLFLVWVTMQIVCMVASAEESHSPTDPPLRQETLAAINRQVEFVLLQPPPETAVEEDTPAPALPRRVDPATRRRVAVAAGRRRRTYRLPSMFGDFFGGSLAQATIQPVPVVLPQVIFDNPGGIDLFVTNGLGQFGANINPAIIIDVRLGDALGPIAASSVAPGFDLSFDRQPDTYNISEPNIPGISPPAAPGPGTITFNNGNAIFVGNAPPVPPPVPANNSVGQGNNWALAYSHTFTPDNIVLTIPVGGGGGAVRRTKIAENNSPVPRNRWLFNYSYFDDVIGGIGDVNRYVVGFEHTFFDDLASVEVRFPLAFTLGLDQVAGGALAKDSQFGDITVITKGLLLARDNCVLSGGLGVSVPIAEDSRVFDTFGTEIVHVDHEAVHLMPFVAMLHNFDSWYWQSFVQLDIDTNGNPVRADPAGLNLQSAGVLQDQTLLFFDVGVGYWLTDPDSEILPPIAATAELHYTTTLQDTDIVNGNGLAIRNFTNRYDVPNLTVGAHIKVSSDVSVRPAMVIPLKNGHDRHFDYEAMLQVNIAGR